MKTLLLARHAKSSWDQSGINDFDRVLNHRGMSDAPVMAMYLKKCGYLIHQIISSDAARALATAEEYAKHLVSSEDLITHHDLYLASDRQIIQLVEALPQAYNTVMLVGHNPGMTDALNYFSQEAVEDMPTCSVGIIQFDITDWSQVKQNSGSLLGFEYPKKHY